MKSESKTSGKAASKSTGKSVSKDELKTISQSKSKTDSRGSAGKTAYKGAGKTARVEETQENSWQSSRKENYSKRSYKNRSMGAVKRTNMSSRRLTEFPNDILAYSENEGTPSINFAKEGTPVHTISFEDKVNVINNGIKKINLIKLKERYGFSLEAVSKILDISDRTIQGKPDNFKFTGNVAEKILGLSEVYSYGVEVFEDVNRFKKWLDTPNRVLNLRRPVELLLTNAGIQRVIQELGRIDYGVY